MRNVLFYPLKLSLKSIWYQAASPRFVAFKWLRREGNKKKVTSNLRYSLFFLLFSSTDVRLERRDDASETAIATAQRFDDHVDGAGKLAPPCGPTRVPPQHAGPGPPLLPGKVKHAASANGGDATADLVQPSQKDEWFV